MSSYDITLCTWCGRLDILSSTSCGHDICAQCINLMIRSNIKSCIQCNIAEKVTCPMCNRPNKDFCIDCSVVDRGVCSTSEGVCGHVCHKHCLHQWMKWSKKEEIYCPLCNKLFCLRN